MFTAREQEALDEVKKTFIKRGFLIQQAELDLIKSVGRGAAGQTYLAKYKDHDVAVKKYSQDILRNDLPSVINEMKFMLDLEHKNIVPFEGIVLELEPPTVMLVSTFAINGDLLDAIHRKKKFSDSPLEEKVVTAMGIAEGLQFIHKAGIIHRDVKCANILLSDSMTPWIADFGFSRLIDRVNTMTGETGSYRYMAPEVIKASKYSDKADVYSFGVCINELFTNEQPFRGTQPYEAARNVVLLGVRPDYRRVPNVTLQKLIRACWQANESRRPSWSLIIGVLQEVLDDIEMEKRLEATKIAENKKEVRRISDTTRGRNDNERERTKAEKDRDPGKPSGDSDERGIQRNEDPQNRQPGADHDTGIRGFFRKFKR
eukprot:CAMPEP_0184740802 /NCGR_PEP_ID=MMETSP0315-20130426/3822_1 /TAXON_ID=101924 /ORGANISM="Rhodosorus marinus, Strain UTEX LB 2760" /LENGTH=372 /DNA_ID=CAMNT_0027210713 /DNA_START=214 /DNA_END=1332 /DNA_ORIENTATION=+